ncbi:hypothetical protein ACSQ67_016505 [Phaseolus vulgaris]
MNIFRLAGDMTHLASVLVLLLKIHTIKSCAGRDDMFQSSITLVKSVKGHYIGITKEEKGTVSLMLVMLDKGVSLKTQELYAFVFACRYLDIFTNYVSLYNTVMKLIFLGSSFSIVWYMRYHKVVRRSYDKDQDTFRHYFLILPCLVLALLINEKFTVKEVMWTFSLYLEAVAILPQLVLLQRTRNIDNLTGQYVFLLGIDLVHPVNAYDVQETSSMFKIMFNIDISDSSNGAWISGLVQTLLYADFFYYYFQSWKNNQKLHLPA